MRLFLHYILLLVFWCLFTNANKETKGNDLIGIWISENNDLIVQVFENKQMIYGKLIWFKCNHKVKLSLEDHKDEKNPNSALRERAWINLTILSDLKYSDNNRWSGGKIYDANSGKTYSASVTLNENQLIVRGYWGIELLGKSMIFNRYKKS